MYVFVVVVVVTFLDHLVINVSFAIENTYLVWIYWHFHQKKMIENLLLEQIFDRTICLNQIHLNGSEGQNHKENNFFLHLTISLHLFIQTND